MFPFVAMNGVNVPHNTNFTDDTSGNFLGKTRMVENDDGTVRWDVWLYNGVAGTLTKGAPYQVTFGSTIPTLMKVIAPATSAFNRYVVFPVAAVAQGAYGWFAFAGYAYDFVLVNDAGVIVGDPLEVINAGTYLIEDAAQSALTVAIALEIATGATVARDVFLPGRPIQSAAA